VSLGTTKSIASLQVEASAGEGAGGLRRVLTATNLTTFGIGAIIGAGIFVLTGTVAATNAGPAVALSFVLAGLGCLFAGLCYAEFAAMIPIAGSAYTYAYATLGEFIAWLVGWNLVLEYMFGSSTVAVGWSGHLVNFLQAYMPISPAWSQAPLRWDEAARHLVRVPGGVINLPALLLVAALTILLVIGIKESARFNNIVVFIKVAVVVLVIACGFAFVNAANWHPFIPPNTGGFGHFGWSGIARGAGLVFFAYIGFDAVSTAAQEAKNPQRDLPIGMLGSLAICTVLYILMALVMTGLVSYKQLNVPAPVVVALGNAPQLTWLRLLTDLGVIVGLASTVLVMLLGQTRVAFSMARDGLLPARFGQVHPRFGTPHVVTIVVGIIGCGLAALFPVDLLAQLVNIGTLLAFVIVSAGVWVLRVRSPHLPRPFRTPFVPVVPALGIVFCFGLMLTLPRDTWIRLAVWTLIGLVVYFGYGRRHSRAAAAQAAATPVAAD
jgi:basic amino acid/polyamine antiporter, APA family